ncbi:MAG: amidohydrolase family protein [Pseudobacteriovorax sp.]|nr:amidohydrolase family protein [Pseudobacteriovorax sp.]
MTARIDVHMNLAGVGTRGSGCKTSSEFRRRYSFIFYRLLHKISRKKLETSADQDWAELVAKTVRESKEVDYGVVLGFDKVYDENGKHLPRFDQMVVPADWVFEVCNSYKELLPCPGLHPYRLDALDALDELAEKKAVCIKWLPPAQNIDASKPQLVPFYKKLADSGIPLLVHTGTEKTFKTQKISRDYIDIARLALPLEHGVKIIAAHSATGVIGTGEMNQRNLLRQMLADFPNLWVDNSGICNPGRFFNLIPLTKCPDILERTIYGSDFPVPCNAFYYLKDFGARKVFELERIRNIIDRDIAIKRRAGYQEETITNAPKVLANLSYWLER